MKTFALVLTLAALSSVARAEETTVNNEPVKFDAKFVCDGALKSGHKLQVTGYFVDGEMRDVYGLKGWKIDHIYVNGVRKPGDEQYNREPVNAYFRASGKIGKAQGGLVPIGGKFFAYKTMNDGAFDHLVIEYAGDNSPNNYMFLMNWDGAPEGDHFETKYVAHGSNVKCRFFWLE